MPENSFTPTTTDADVSAYQDTDLSQLNTIQEAERTAEKKLEYFMIRVVFVAKILTWIGVAVLMGATLYGWTRHQKQDSWFMNLPMNTKSSPLCAWMNHGNADNLNKKQEFREFVIAEGKQNLIDIQNSDRCIASDTIVQLLELEKKFASIELGKAYESVIPKKYLGTTIDATPELDIIIENAPVHRINHTDVLGTISNATAKLNDKNTTVGCQEIHFLGLNAEVTCKIETRAPTQPRKKAIEFMESLENTGNMLVTYPNTLDMKVNEESKMLTTNFTFQITYIPARYEANRIQKLTYDKR